MGHKAASSPEGSGHDSGEKSRRGERATLDSTLPQQSSAVAGEDGKKAIQTNTKAESK